MADTISVRPLGLIRQLEITLGGYAFTISIVVLQLDTPGAYPLLLGRPSLKTTHIKQRWQKNKLLAFKGGKQKSE